MSTRELIEKYQRTLEDGPAGVLYVAVQKGELRQLLAVAEAYLKTHQPIDATESSTTASMFPSNRSKDMKEINV